MFSDLRAMHEAIEATVKRSLRVHRSRTRPRSAQSGRDALQHSAFCCRAGRQRSLYIWEIEGRRSIRDGMGWNEVVEPRRKLPRFSEHANLFGPIRASYIFSSKQARRWLPMSSFLWIVTCLTRDLTNCSNNLVPLIVNMICVACAFLHDRGVSQPWAPSTDDYDAKLRAHLSDLSHLHSMRPRRRPRLYRL